MLKKENFISIIVIVVGLAFLIISVLVFFSKGNVKLVKYKLKLGAVLIGLSVTPASPISCTCYAEGPPEDIFTFDVEGTPNYNNFTIRLPKDSLLKGTISYSVRSQYSYMIQDTLKNEIVRDNIIPDDGSFNSSTEKFSINIPSTLNAGYYFLKVYITDKSYIKPESYFRFWKMKITK